MSGVSEPQCGAGAMRSAADDVAMVSGWLRRIERHEAARDEVFSTDARAGLARRLKTTPAVLKHIRDKRRKEVSSWLMRAIRGVLIDVLQREIRELEHEAHLALQIGLDHRDDALGEAQAALATAKEILRQAAAGG